MRTVDFHEVEAGAASSRRGGREVADQRFDLGLRQRARRRPAVHHRDRAGRNRFPGARRVGFHQRRSAFQRHCGAGLATRVRELNAHRNFLIVVQRDDLAQSGDVTLFIDAEAAGCDPTIARDRCRLDDCTANAAERKASVMRQVPQARVAVARDVLAHRRDYEPIAKRDGSDCVRLEERGHPCDRRLAHFFGGLATIPRTAVSRLVIRLISLERRRTPSSPSSEKRVIGGRTSPTG